MERRTALFAARAAVACAALLMACATNAGTEDEGSGFNNTAGTLPLAGVGGASGVGAAGTVAGTSAGTLAGTGVSAAGMSAGAAGTAVAGTMAPAGAGGAAGVAGTAAGLGGVGGAAGMATAGAAGMGTAGMAVAGAGGGNTPGTVTVTFTTVSYGGEYAPLNYGAVWFEKADGSFVKTAKRWAGVVHASDLTSWTEASGGWGSIFGGGNMADMADAISMATIRTHEMHTVTWNMMDSTPALVPDGDYVAVLEMSESRARDRDGPVVRIPFTKGASPQMATANDQEGFSGVSLQYTP